MDWAKTTARRDKKHLSFGIWCIYIRDFTVYCSLETRQGGQLYSHGPPHLICSWHHIKDNNVIAQIAKFMGPTWGPSGADRTQVGPLFAPWTLLSERVYFGMNTSKLWEYSQRHYSMTFHYWFTKMLQIHFKTNIKYFQLLTCLISMGVSNISKLHVNKIYMWDPGQIANTWQTKAIA